MLYYFYMPRHRKMTIFLILAILLTLISPALAQENETGNNGFNANFLISDEEIQNFQSMNRADIQAFLEDYESFLARYRALDKDGIERLSSDIIYRATQEHRINPKYLLVKLQKEQSLITDKSPAQKQFDGACGYGITDGCGWNCEAYLNNKGFGKQVDSSAGIIRWYYDNVNKEIWIKRPKLTYIIDGQVVMPQNFATAFLYTYTPHIEGNKNFWSLWQSWFGQTYPDGSLIKTYNDSAVYFLQEGKKRAIKSMAVLTSRFDPKMILTVPSAELDNYPNSGDLSFPNYSILKQGDNYYLVDFDAIRPFANFEVVRKIGYNPGEFIEVAPADLQNYELGQVITAEIENPIGKLVRVKENNNLYFLKNNILQPVSDPQTANINFPSLKEEKVSIAVLQNYQLGDLLKFKDGALFGIIGSNKIYVMENGKKRHIASEEIFNTYGYDWKNIIWTDLVTGISHPTGQPIYLPARLQNPN